jgi:hypothetical protein
MDEDFSSSGLWLHPKPVFSGRMDELLVATDL